MWARGSDCFVGVYFDSGARLDVLWKSLQNLDETPPPPDDGGSMRLVQFWERLVVIADETTMGDLRASKAYHQIGRNLCAGFTAQRLGITANTAIKKVPEQASDSWLLIAHFAQLIIGLQIEAVLNPARHTEAKR
jgi:hypothetical protein